MQVRWTGKGGPAWLSSMIPGRCVVPAHRLLGGRGRDHLRDIRGSRLESCPVAALFILKGIVMMLGDLDGVDVPLPDGAMVALTQQELESRLWAAANSLRGPVDPSDFKSYIFPLLFYKRISDGWDDEHARSGGRLRRVLSGPGNRGRLPPFPVPRGMSSASTYARFMRTSVSGYRTSSTASSRPTRTRWREIFGDVQWAAKEKLPERALLDLIQSFQSLDLRPSNVDQDVLGNAYEYLLKQFADVSGKKAGEFFTPRSVVRLLTRILDPQPTDTVYDPACGSGGMLIEAANEVMEATGSVRQMRFYGQEVNLTTSAIARMNLFLHDIEDVVIRRGDTLREPKFLDERGRLQRFDVVITNPPFSLKNWGGEVWRQDPWGRAACGQPPASNGDFAWVQHMVASMKPHTGRVGVVMPHGVLFRGAAERTIRECLLRSDRLDAVLSLPLNLFYSTNIPACLLIFRATKAADGVVTSCSSMVPSGTPRAQPEQPPKRGCRGPGRVIPDGFGRGRRWRG